MMSRKAESSGREGAMRSLLMVGALALAVSIPALRHASAQTAPLHYGDPAVVLVGTLSVEQFYGPPGFGETPDKDAKERPFILNLESPVDVKAGKDEQAETAVKKLTLVFDPDELSLKPFLGKKVRVEGVLFHSFSGHHHTAVLIEVSKIRPQATDGRLRDAPNGLRPDEGKVRAEVGRIQTKVTAGVAAPNYDGEGALVKN